MMQDITRSNSSHQQLMNSLLCNGTNILPLMSNMPMPQNGLKQLQDHCATIYTNQQTLPPFYFRPDKPFIGAGGSEPLEHIAVYRNPGHELNGVPRHWHYVGFGLSDIHNYTLLCQMDSLFREQNPIFAETTKPLEQIYPKPGSTQELLSGFGFELTFRVKCNSDDDWNDERPPEWPSKVMRALAKYVFQSKNVFDVGDHAAWHCPLSDEDQESDSIVRHLLMTLDPQLKEAETDLGKVKFIQLVGVAQGELEAAQEWSVMGILDIMKERVETGGCFSVTDMMRGENIFQLDPNNREKIDEGIRTSGSNMAIISAKHRYSSSTPKWYKDAETKDDNDDYESNADHDDEADHRHQFRPYESERYDFEDNDIAGRENLLSNDSNLPSSSQNYDMKMRCSSRMSYESESALMVENAEFAETRYYDRMYILLSYESAKILPVILNGRLRHKRDFTYKSFKGDLWTTFVPEGGTSECLVNRDQPYVRKGVWLQIYVPDELCREMLEKVKDDFSHNPEDDEERPALVLPKNYSWPKYNLYITVVEDIVEAE